VTANLFSKIHPRSQAGAWEREGEVFIACDSKQTLKSTAAATHRGIAISSVRSGIGWSDIDGRGGAGSIGSIVIAGTHCTVSIGSVARLIADRSRISIANGVIQSIRVGGAIAGTVQRSVAVIGTAGCGPTAIAGTITPSSIRVTVSISPIAGGIPEISVSIPSIIAGIVSARIGAVASPGSGLFSWKSQQNNGHQAHGSQNGRTTHHCYSRLFVLVTGRKNFRQRYFNVQQVSGRSPADLP